MQHSEIRWDYTFLRRKMIGCLENRSQWHLHWTHVTDVAPIEDILTDRDFPWDYKEVSSRLMEVPDRMWEVVCSRSDDEWDWWAISMNPGITWDIVLENPGKPWCFRTLASNPSWLLSMRDKERVCREVRASNVIKRMWKECSSNPAYAMCRKIKLEEFHSMTETS